jgi:hypothetical protein
MKTSGFLLDAVAAVVVDVVVVVVVVVVDNCGKMRDVSPGGPSLDSFTSAGKYTWPSGLLLSASELRLTTSAFGK